MRDGPGAEDRQRERAGGRRRTARHDAAAVARCALHAAGFYSRDGAPFSRCAALARGHSVSMDAVCAHYARRAVGGLAVLFARSAVAAHGALQHVHAHRARRRRGVCIQRGGDARAADFSAHDARRCRRAGVLRGCRRDHRARAPRAGARVARPRPHRHRDPRAARSRARHGAARGRGRRTRSPARPRRRRRDTAGATRRENSRGWKDRGGQFERGRIHAHRRTHPRRESRGQRRDRRHDQRHRRISHASRARRQRDDARAHRADGRRSAAQPRADPGARGSCGRMVRTRGSRRCGAHVCAVAVARAGATPRARARECRRRAHHRVPVRPSASRRR